MFEQHPDVAEGARIIRAGGIVAFPTETVYGLGADGFNPTAIAAVFAAKGRPRFDPLIIHLADWGDLELAAEVQALPAGARRRADRLCRHLWPGPLTLIFPKQPAIPDLATSGLPTVAVRVPAHRIARELIRLSTRAIAAPSANPFGYLSPTTAAHVREQLGSKVGLIIDGGPAGIGVESTVLDLTAEPPRILRPGGTPREAIEALIGPVAVGSAPARVAGAPAETPASPGQLSSHYAPRIPLFLHPPGQMPAEYSPEAGYLFFSSFSYRRQMQTWGRSVKGEKETIRVLTESGALTEAAANFFSLLHDLDRLPISSINAEQAPGDGLGSAINDRLARAACSR